GQISRCIAEGRPDPRPGKVRQPTGPECPNLLPGFGTLPSISRLRRCPLSSGAYRPLALAEIWNSSHCARRRSIFSTVPWGMNSTYRRLSDSNLGQLGSDVPLGSPVFAKFVQYCCICAETVRSPSELSTALPPQTYGSSAECAAAWVPMAGSENSYCYTRFPPARCSSAIEFAG